MTFRDIIVLALAAAAFGFALYRVIKAKKRGVSCCGNCSGCTGCPRGTDTEKENKRG